MPCYPVNLNLENRLCVVVGGGPVGCRKVDGLLAAGARVRLIAPRVASLLPEAVAVERRAFRTGDLAGALLAFAATDDPQVNAAVVAEAAAEGVLVCRADAPLEGDFTLPALLRRGALTLGVATAGESPALAATVRDLLAHQYGPEWSAVASIAAALRRKRLTLQDDTEYNSEILRRLLREGLPALLAAGDAATVDRLLAEAAGPGATLAALGVRLSKGEP